MLKFGSQYGRVLCLLLLPPHSQISVEVERNYLPKRKAWIRTREATAGVVQYTIYHNGMDKSKFQLFNQKIKNVSLENHSETVGALLGHLEMKIKKKEKKELKYKKVCGELLQNLKIQAYALKQDYDVFQNDNIVLRNELAKWADESEKITLENKNLKENEIKLKNEISQLKDAMNLIREEKLVNESELESKVRVYEQKCEEFIDMMFKKQGCSRGEPSGNNCCESANFKTSVLELLQEEFSCCICDEILVEATLTKCNHIFCAHCLRESKKRNRTCPICRTDRIQERRVTFIDKYITNVMKLLSDELYAGRIQLVEDRRSPLRKTLRND